MRQKAKQLLDAKRAADFLTLRSDVDLRDQIESLVKAGTQARLQDVCQCTRVTECRSAQVCEQLLRERQEEPGRSEQISIIASL